MAFSHDEGVQIVIDPAEWYRLKKSLDAFDPAITRALRKRIRNVGNIAADEVKKTLRLPAPSGGADNTHGRDALIAATKVTVSFAQRAAGARIITGSGGLDPKHKGLLKVYNLKTFRHPVFESRDQMSTRHFYAGRQKDRAQWQREGFLAPWVEQKGRPYFGSAIYRALNRAAINEIRAALDEATTAIGARAV